MNATDVQRQDPSFNIYKVTCEFDLLPSSDLAAFAQFAHMIYFYQSLGYGVFSHAACGTQTGCLEQPDQLDVVAINFKSYSNHIFVVVLSPSADSSGPVKRRNDPFSD